MVIVCSKPGQLGNLLVVYANFYAYHLETGTKVANPAFYEYQHYFEGTRRGSKILNTITYTICFNLARVLARFNINNRLISCVRLDWHEQCDMSDTEATKAFGSSICLAQGWQFRSEKLTHKYRKQIKELFSLAPDYQKKLDEFFNKTFTANEIIIGLHIRHGDYAAFENGRYFYSFEQYKDILVQLCQLFPYEKLHFLICSNTRVPMEVFTGLNARVSQGPGHEALDMHSFARCQYIVGPPSTYTIWASYYGGIPLCMLNDITQPLSKESFKIVNGF